MATQAEINAHDQLISRLADELATGLESLLTTALLGLNGIDLSDRVALNNLFATVREFINQRIQALDVLAVDNLNLNGIAPTDDISAQVVTLKNATANVMAVAVDEEVNTIAGELVTAALLGLGVATVIRSVVDRVPMIIARLRRAFDQALITFTSVLTRNVGSGQFKYTGGLIPTSRPFCTQHNGNIYNETEINRIWSATWQGKAPGDPFVVRGGYNCRHFWVVAQEE